jgi:hypothetical protein
MCPLTGMPETAHRLPRRSESFRRMCTPECRTDGEGPSAEHGVRWEVNRPAGGHRTVVGSVGSLPVPTFTAGRMSRRYVEARFGADDPKEL